MELAIVNLANNNCHRYGSQVLARAVNFARANDISGDSEILWHTLAHQMMLDSPDTLILAAVEGNVVHGHFIARLLNFDGELKVMITQLAIDKPERDGREETMRAGMEKTIEWAKLVGATGVRCWAMTPLLAKLFKRFGLEAKDYVLMELDLN